MLKVENYSYAYANREVIKNLDLIINTGDYVCLVGANGAGKTTLLKSLAGINDDYKGNISLDGNDLRKKKKAYKMKIGYVAEEVMLLDYLTGIQYLNFMSDIYEVSESKRKKIVDKYAKLLNIEDKLGELITTYSHGNRQKIAILGAIIHEPDLLILDEPLVGLDPKGIKSLETILKELNKNGVTILLATHILAMVDKLGSKILLVNDGKFKMIDNPYKLAKIEKEYEDFNNV